MNKNHIISQLYYCLLTDNKVDDNKWKIGYDDEWPVIKIYPLEQ